MFHARLSTVFFLVAAAATAAVAQSGDDCPFFPGICPVTLDNTVGVSKDITREGTRQCQGAQ